LEKDVWKLTQAEAQAEGSSTTVDLLPLIPEIH